jgi:hypothetical protein
MPQKAYYPGERRCVSRPPRELYWELTDCGAAIVPLPSGHRSAKRRRLAEIITLRESLPALFWS